MGLKQSHFLSFWLMTCNNIYILFFIRKNNKMEEVKYWGAAAGPTFRQNELWLLECFRNSINCFLNMSFLTVFISLIISEVIWIKVIYRIVFIVWFGLGQILSLNLLSKPPQPHKLFRHFQTTWKLILGMQPYCNLTRRIMKKQN